MTKCQICGQDNPLEAGFCGNCGATLLAAVEAPPPAVAPVVAAEYAGFWIRFGAVIIDGVIVLFIFWVLLRLIFSLWADVFGFPLLLLLYHWLFIGLVGQTPGKMAVRIKVVNAAGDRPGLGCAALREILGKLISTIVLFMGFLWIVFDDDKQGWHDKIASTYVVKVESRRQEEKGL